MYYILYFALLAVVSYFIYVPFRAAAQYRFRGQLGLTIEFLGFLACAVLALLNIASFTGIVLLAVGVAAGVGMRSNRDNNQRYLD
jgi:hypothetical protein